MSRKPQRILWAVACYALVAGAAAHPLQVTGVVVHADDHTTSVSVIAHLPLPCGADPATCIAQRIHILLDGEPFQPARVSLQTDAGNGTITWTARQDRHAGSIAMLAPVFPERAGDTTVVLVYRGERLVDRMALSPAHPSATVGESLLAVVLRFISMGIMHILSGPDHVLFVLGLVLTRGTARQLFGLVTAFTLSHSVTLTLTSLGVASLSPNIVEPIIAFSIVVVGLENLFRRKSDYLLRVGLAFCFGFFHGFGFAGALGEVGLPAQAIGWSLASFNIGVEIGQASILMLVLPLLALAQRHRAQMRELITRYASVGIAAAGAFWFVERVISIRFTGNP